MQKNTLARPDAIRALRLFGVGTVLAFFWIGLNLVFPKLAPTGIPFVVTRLIIHGVILVGLWLGLSRTGLDRKAKVFMTALVFVPFTIWFCFIFYLALKGVFDVLPGATVSVPPIPVALFLPLLVTLPLILRSKKMASLLDVMPASWLIGLQLYRILGGLFLVNWLLGTSPGGFAIPAGVADVIVGVLALPVAVLVSSRMRAGLTIGVFWNLLGLLDFAVSIVLTSRSGGSVGTFPTVMTPAFTVPVSILLHVLSLWQLTRRAKSSAIDEVIK